MNSEYRIIKDRAYGQIVSEDASQKHLKEFFNMKNTLSRADYAKGEEWFKSELSLEDAPIELQQNISFKLGFERGERLALIEKLSNVSKKR